MAGEKRKYPSKITISGRNVTLRYMSATDKAGVLTFARALPEHDLLFLRRDITEDREVDAWIEDIDAGIVKSVLAVEGGAIVGYGTVHRNDLRWSSHVAELRVMVAESMRGKGLGRVLTQEAFAVALEEGIEKMMAQMTLDQKGAITTFEGLGFRLRMGIVGLWWGLCVGLTVVAVLLFVRFERLSSGVIEPIGHDIPSREDGEESPASGR